MKYALILALAVMLPMISACNTMQGLGTDVERGGENLQDAAQDAKN